MANVRCIVSSFQFFLFLLRCVKILRLSNACVVENMDIGFVVNLMSVDSLRLSMTCRSLHDIVTMPIYLALATFFFFETIHWPALIGMLVMVTVVPLVTTIVTINNKRLQVLLPNNQSSVNHSIDRSIDQSVFQSYSQSSNALTKVFLLTVVFYLSK